MTARARQPRRGDASLTVEETVAGARRLIEVGGADSLSMRKLAQELGVSPMTIYLRFENKDALLRAVRHQVISEVVDRQVLSQLTRSRGEPVRTWQEDALTFALSLRSHLLAHPFGPGMYEREDWALAAAALSDHGLAIMERAGFEGAAAVTAFRALFWHAASFAVADDAIRVSITHDSDEALGEIAEDRLSTYRRYRDHFGDTDADALFEETTRILIEGLAHRAQSQS